MATTRWCTNCQTNREAAYQSCHGSCGNNCNDRCATCNQQTLVDGTVVAQSQAQVQAMVREVVNQVQQHGGVFECKIEDRGANNQVFRTTTWTYKR